MDAYTQGFMDKLAEMEMLEKTALSYKLIAKVAPKLLRRGLARQTQGLRQLLRGGSEGMFDVASKRLARIGGNVQRAASNAPGLARGQAAKLVDAGSLAQAGSSEGLSKLLRTMKQTPSAG